MEQTAAGMAQRSLKEKQRQEREELILQVAEEVMMEKGYYDTSIDEIAARVGIAKGTVYLHFPGKEDLVIAIFQREMRQVSGQIDEILITEQSAHDKLEAILNCLYGDTLVKRMQFLNSLHTSGDMISHWKERGQKLRGEWEKLASRVTEVLEQGKAAGEFTQDIPNPVLLTVFFCLMSPRSYERLIVEERMAGNEIAAYLGRIYFKGITTRREETK